MTSAAGAYRNKAKAIRKMVDDLPTAAKPVSAAIRLNLKGDTGGDRKLSGLKNGKPMTVTSKTSRIAGLTTVDIAAGPARQRAPWFWLNEGTRGGRRRHRGSGRSYRHPGTKAKRTWSKPIESKLPGIEADLKRKWESAIRSR